jgi:hypothetical protein
MKFTISILTYVAIFMTTSIAGSHDASSGKTHKRAHVHKSVNSTNVDSLTELLCSAIAPIYDAHGIIDSTVYYRTNLAMNENTPRETLDMLTHDKDLIVREYAIMNESTDIDTLYNSIHDTNTTRMNFRYATIGALARSVIVRRSRSINDVTDIMFMLDPDINVRYDIAYGTTDTNVLTVMSADSAAWIRKAVAGNKHTPNLILTNLGSDTSVMVRSAVAGNKHASNYTLYFLENDTSVTVRSAIAGNKSTPDWILTFLGSDTSAEVQSDLPEFWRYWSMCNDINGKLLVYTARHAINKTDAGGNTTITIWLNFSKGPKAKVQEPKQYDLSCLENRYSITGTNKSIASTPGSRWFKIIRYVCDNFTRTSE